MTAQQIQPGALVRRELSGIVLDSSSRLPVPGASVRVSETTLETQTEADGRFHLVGMLPTRVTVVVRRIGYAPAKIQTDLTRPGSTLSIVIAARAQTIEGVHVRVDSAAQFLRSQQATSTMSAKQVQEERGQTLGETIKALPGVSLIQYGPSIAKPVVRGLHSQRIATINAGVPQEGQQWGGEHAPEIDAFAANQIEVIRGPGTILYGSGALGGVVKVMPRPLPFSGDIGGEFSMNGFSNNRQGAASALLEGSRLPLPLLGGVSWRAQVSARRAGDAETPSYYLPNTGFKEVDYNAAIGITRPWGTSEFDYSHFGTELGLYVGAHVGNLDDLNRAMQTPFTASSFTYSLGKPNQKVQHELFAWRTTWTLPKEASVEASYGFQYNDRREYDSHGFASTGSRPAFALELYTTTLDLKYHHPPVGRLRGTVGVAGMRQGNLSPGRSFLIPQYRLYTGGLFALEEFTISRLTISAGSRGDYRWQHAYQYGAPVVISPDDQRSYTGFSGSLGASLALAETWSLASTLSRAWRPPNVNERFSQGVHHGTAQYEIGDTSLVPERSLNTDVTLRHLGAHTRFELSAYQNHIAGYIYLRPTDPILTVRGAYPGYRYSQTDARLQGAELTVQVEPVTWMSLYGSANVLRGTDLPTGDPLYDMPADRLTTSVRFFGPNTARAEAPYFEIGGTLVRRQDQVPPVTIYKLPTAGYGLLNVEVGATALTIGALRAEPSLAVRNVLNSRYRDYLSRYRLFVDEPGRDIVLRLTLPFGATHQ
ncbi:MAG TPA: TonB-dependent receptor [Gemmatimonadaceae bacterium]